MNKKLMLLMVFLLLGIGWTSAQVSKVTGVVILEDDGLPVMGAMVTVKGTTIKTVTDLDGNFTLSNLPSTAKTLVVSFIGTKSKEVAIKPNLNIVLESDTKELEEVMVVAYGTATKSSFTGSAAVLSSEDINKIQVSDATQALTGKVAGVQMNMSSGQPGTSSPTIRIRGISSITAGNDPLIIVDGAPYDGDMNSINTQDIESMTVLKDAASNALYGARGANGVIMITTKKGKSGDARVTFDAKWGSNSRSTRDYNIISNPAQYYEMYYASLKNYYMNQGQDAATAHVSANNAMFGTGDFSLGYNVYNVPANQFLIGTNGKLNPNATLGRVVNYNGQDFYLYPTNWADEAYQTGVRQEYNLSVSGGNEKSSFYTSLGYLDNEGITMNSDYQRLTGRLKADYQVKDWLKVGANMSYNHMDTKSLGGDGTSGGSDNIFSFAMLAPIYPLYIRDGNGNIIRDNNNIPRYDYGDGENAGLIRPALTAANAFSDVLLNDNSSESNAFNGNAFADIRFNENLKFTWTSGVNLDETRSTQSYNPFYGQTAAGNGTVNKYHIRSYSYNHQQLLNYNKTFANVHDVAVMIGHEYFRSKYYFLSGSKTNMFDYTNTELDGAITENGSSSYVSDYNTEGFFGRLQYDYKQKYFGSVSFRRDASSRFHPEHRWGNFWSFGGAWLIDKEDFFDVDWINSLKYKASYGSQGNDNIGDYRYINTYTITNADGRPAAVPATMGNEDITWETNGNFNTGFEFELFNSRLSGSIEYFYRKTTDMLFAFPLPASFGFTSYYDNVGDMRNQGVEAEFNYTAYQNKDLRWDVKLNLTHYKNKVIYLADENKTSVVEGHGGYTSGMYFYGEDLPLYTFYMAKYAGVSDKGEALYYKDVKGEDGKITRSTTTNFSDATKYLCGSALPDLYGGFGTSLEWKGLDFSVDFAYQIGGKTYDTGYSTFMSNPSGVTRGLNFHADLLNAWTPENAGSDIPRLQFGDDNANQTSDRFLTSASYLSIQNINLGYTLPSKAIKPLNLQNVRLYLVADNVWVWSKRQGLDPRQSLMGQPNSQTYAPIRTISGGVTVTF